MQDTINSNLINHLSSFITKERLNLLKEKINYRTKHITLVLEDVFQSRNISAAMRSADCFGLQDIHIIEENNDYTTDNTVSLGSDKWLTIKKYDQIKNNTTHCIEKLRKENYQIIATSPKNTDISLEEINLENNKIALLFGNEMNGLSNTALELSDYKMNIKMYGFTESLNISASAAICSQYLSNKIRKSNIKWEMNQEEKEKILLNWLRKSIKSSSIIEERFFSKK